MGRDKVEPDLLHCFASTLKLAQGEIGFNECYNVRVEVGWDERRQ